MTRTVAVIQARLGSQRFPGKMLAKLAGHTLIEWVVTRVKMSTSLDRVLVATTTDELDDRLVAACDSLGVQVCRGSTDDVLGRFISSLADDAADVVVRVCADNPFVDPHCIDVAVHEFRTRNVEYAFNHRPWGTCNYADGFGVEVVSRKLLERTNQMQLSTTHREHVTLAVADGTVAARVHGCVAPAELARPELAFDVDEPADLERLQKLIDGSNLSITSSAADVVGEARTMMGKE